MRVKKGTVVSNKMDKTVVVETVRYEQHPKYRKKYAITKKFKAHDPENKLNVGDAVTIYETRPISKTVCWTTVKPNKETKSE